MMRRSIALIGLLAVAAIAGSFLWHNRPAARHRDFLQQREANRQEAADRFARMPFVELVAGTPVLVLDALAQLPRRFSARLPADTGGAAAGVGSLLELVEAHLAARASADPGGYEQLLLARGYRLRDIGGSEDERVFLALDDSAIRATYNYYTGSPPPEGLSPIEYFRFRFVEELRWRNGALIVTS